MQLATINREKDQVSRIIGNAIDGAWIKYANAMGFVYHERDAPESRQIVSMNDLRQALRLLNDNECLAALYFLTGYIRDVIHPQVLWGATHQVAVEDFVMTQLNASFSVPRVAMKPGNKTCVSQLYSLIYNRKKQKLLQQVQPSTKSLAMDSRGFKASPHWKRPKTHYFVHTKVPNSTGMPSMTTELVRDTCTRTAIKSDTDLSIVPQIVWVQGALWQDNVKTSHNHLTVVL